MKTIKAFIAWLLDLTLCTKSEIKSLKRQLLLKDEIIKCDGRKIVNMTERLDSTLVLEAKIRSLTMRLQLAQQSNKSLLEDLQIGKNDRIRLVGNRNAAIAELIEKNNNYNELLNKYQKALDDIANLEARVIKPRDSKGKFIKKSK